jgi:hypothetical protein
MSANPQDRRRFERVATDKAVEVETGRGTYRGSVVDISLRGLLMHYQDSPPAPGIGESATVRVRLDDDDCCIDLEGSIAHVEGRQLGLHCTRMDLDSAARLRRLVELNIGDNDLLERQLSELIAD